MRQIGSSAKCVAACSIGSPQALPFSVAVEDANKQSILLCVGLGFQTKDPKVMGVIHRLNREGDITSYQLLWDQEYINERYPNSIGALRPFFVIETDYMETKEDVKPCQIVRTFLVNPLALMTASDMSGKGNMAVVGIAKLRGDPFVSSVIRLYDCCPWAVQGVQSILPMELLKANYGNNTLFSASLNLDGLRHQLAAQIEDGIRDAAWARSEETGRRSDTVEIRGLLGGQTMSMLYKLTPEDAYTASYRANCLMMTYENWDSLEPVMGRNASRTSIQSMNVCFEVGPPVFKWLMGPIEKFVVTFSHFKLLNAAGTASTSTNEGTPHALREKNAILSDRRQCWFCLRRKVTDDPCNGCVCTNASLFGQPQNMMEEPSKSMEVDDEDNDLLKEGEDN